MSLFTEELLSLVSIQEKSVTKSWEVSLGSNLVSLKNTKIWLIKFWSTKLKSVSLSLRFLTILGLKISKRNTISIKWQLPQRRMQNLKKSELKKLKMLKLCKKRLKNKKSWNKMPFKKRKRDKKRSNNNKESKKSFSKSNVKLKNRKENDNKKKRRRSKQRSLLL